MSQINIPYAITNQPWILKHILSYHESDKSKHKKGLDKVIQSIKDIRDLRKKQTDILIGSGGINCYITTYSPQNLITQNDLFSFIEPNRDEDFKSMRKIFTKKTMNKFNSRYQYDENRCIHVMYMEDTSIGQHLINEDTHLTPNAIREVIINI